MKKYNLQLTREECFYLEYILNMFDKSDYLITEDAKIKILSILKKLIKVWR